MATRGDPVQVLQDLPDLTSDLAEALGLAWSRAQEGLGTRVSPSQLRALLVVERHGEINVNGLAEELGAVASSASRLCDRLQAAGLLRRVSSPHNRREVLVALTVDGRRLLAELAQRRRRDLAEVLAGMSPAGRASLLTGLVEFARVSEPAHRLARELA
jgi:DNA-binding MarR family transcriptional regulator